MFSCHVGGTENSSGSRNILVLTLASKVGRGTMGSFHIAPLIRQMAHHASPNMNTGAYGSHSQHVQENVIKQK